MAFVFFFFNDTATTEIYTLSLHDALPISMRAQARASVTAPWSLGSIPKAGRKQVGTGHSGGGEVSRLRSGRARSEEHTSELQSRQYLVCRLLLEKKKNIHLNIIAFHITM